MKHSLSHIKTLADAQNLLNRKPLEPAQVEAVLGLLGQALELARVRLFKLSADGSLFEPLALWSHAGIAAGENTTLSVNALLDPETAPGRGFAQPIHDGAKLDGMLFIETNTIHEAFVPEDHELIRSTALLLAPHLKNGAETPAPPKLNAPKEGVKPPPSNELHILIVEDDEANLFMIQKFIERFGAIPHAARNGQDAIQVCKEMKFDVILMDLTMPKLDGFDATREIVTGANLNRKTPIIAVTADVTEGIERRCKKIGMQHYIAKPVRRDTLIRALTDLTNKKPKKKI